MIMYRNGVLIAFGELFLKSDSVKTYFKQKLVDGLLFFIKKGKLEAKVMSLRERIFISSEDSESISKLVENTFGISWYANCMYFPKTNLKEFTAFVDKNYPSWIKERETFAIRLKISSGIKLDVRDVVERIARNIDRKVDLEKPKKELFIEVRKSGWFIYFKKEKGAGGFPIGSAGKVLALTSGGIDSPVASYLIAKKGAENIWLHFHSFPLVSNKSIEKVKDLTKVFLKYQPRLKIYFVPFSKAQVQIKGKAPANCRILLYRRLMLRVADIIAEKEGCKALVTGESLGQVSSQTLPNLSIIESVIKTPVLRPLIAFDKQDIMDLAKKIGTYDISIRPQEDCCTLFTPKHANAHGKLEEIEKMEKKINTKKLIIQIIKDIKVVVE